MLLVWEKKKKKFSRSQKSESTLNGRQTGRLAEELVAFWTVTETGRE